MSDLPAAVRSVAVLHLIDTLEVGGAEHMTANIVNELPRARYHPHICTTRRPGALVDLLKRDVPFFCLDRRGSVDLPAIRKLLAYIRSHDVRVLHAHGSAIFIAVLAARFVPGVAVVWHVHHGRLATDRSRGTVFRLLVPYVDHVVAVSQPLTSWARVRLGIKGDRISYIPNFVVSSPSAVVADLPGAAGERIVCVANFLPAKGHTSLMEAMAGVVRVRPSAHLILVGQGNGNACERALRAGVRARSLEANVSFLGQRRDVMPILRGSDIGVLSSHAEGLPLALIEYGEAALAVAVTDVGQCADVVDHGAAGIVVPPRHPEQLADALLLLLADPHRRQELGGALRERVEGRFDRVRVVHRLCAVYDKVLRTKRVPLPMPSVEESTVRYAHAAPTRAGAIS